ncbi:MAG: FAD:protein FMN transferase [Bacteroidales bacterium]|nr:FAD:protein FMN transferase [Bacteroidales bacterium]
MKMKSQNYLNCSFIFFCLLLFSFISCKGRNTVKDPEYFHTQIQIFKTSANIKYSYPRELGKEISARLDSVALSMNPDNNKTIISKVNNNMDVEADDWFIACFNKAQEIAALTDGVYDITAAPLINLWGFGFQKMDQVTPGKIDSLKQFVGYKKVRLEGRKIIKEDPRLQLNMSSIAKGYSCDVIADLFEGYGIENYMIEIGGEIRAKGKNPKGRTWTIGITTPIDDRSGEIKETQEIVFLHDYSLATSGNYRNFYVRDGKKYAHTIDPRTGYPSEANILSASVFAADCMTADAFATAFMALGLEKSVRLADQIPGMTYLFIYSGDGETLREVRSANFDQLLEGTN